MSANSPIGVFDSGYGGLTILSEIRKKLPHYDYIYLGDNARTPYGTRSFEVVYQYTLEAVRKLFEMDCHLVILACNTASAKALRNIQQKDLPLLAPEKRILGVIRPVTEDIGNFTNTNHIGILGTEGTVNSLSYPIEIFKFFPQITVMQEACPMWVPLVENNELNSEGTHYFVRKHLNNLLYKDNQIDTLVLGCTHYPLLLPVIKYYLPENIRIVVQGEIVANKLENYLMRHPEIDEKCSKNSSCTYYTTENPEIFSQRAQIFTGHQTPAMHLDLTN